MTDSLERFLQDLHFAVPAGLEHRAKAAAATDERAQLSERLELNWQRHPRALALVAALLAIAIVATLLFGMRSLHPKGLVPGDPGPPRAAYGATCPTEEFGGSNNQVPTKMVSPTIGWAKGPLRTTDGGAHWRDVSPPSLPNRSRANNYGYGFVDAEFFLDSTHAWTIQPINSSATSAIDHLVTFATTDGGQTWQQSAPIRLISLISTISPRACFIDAQHGWLLVQLLCPTSATPGNGVLYATTDGGLHWHLAWNSSFGSSRCESNITIPGTDGATYPACLPVLLGVTFVSPTTGWASTCRPDAPALLVTHDGGVSWKVQGLPATTTASDSNYMIGCRCEVSPLPVFFNDRQGLLVGVNGLLTTADGGSTWIDRDLPPYVPPSSFPMDFLDANTGWVTGGNSLYRTDDGGKTWARVPSNIFSYGAFIFVDLNHGFAWPNGNRSKTTLGLPIGAVTPPEMWTTSDGGRTWKVVVQQIVGQ